jgi:hypothetical protein
LPVAVEAGLDGVLSAGSSSRRGQEEMGLLLRAWDGSSHGRGQVVLIRLDG